MKRLALFAFLLAVLACSRSADEAPPASKLVMRLDAKPIAAKANVPAADVTALVHNNDEFALDLYRRLSKEPGNLFFSPYSLSSALAMTYAGARGDTAAEMAKTLHLGLEPDKLHPAFAELNQQLLSEQRGYQLNIANALWAQSGYPFEEPFVLRLKDSYGAGLGTVDFAGNPTAARQAINGWVSKQTQGKIPELLGEVSPFTRFVLTNAVYFLADWAEPFPKPATQDRPFWRSKEDKLQVPMMSAQRHYGYLEEKGFQALELPYQSRFSLVVILPRQIEGLAELEGALTSKALHSWLEALQREEVRVQLPRFKVQSAFSLKSTLSALGMPLAFSKQADFSGLSPRAREDELAIAAVVHQAYIDVNEKGTEAAAASAVKGKSAPAPVPPQPKIFQADHPFLYLIRDRLSGTILFLGRLTDPRPT
jgi:serpin B